MNPTFDEVMRLDQSLQFLAAYEVSGGRMIIPKSIEEMAEMNTKISEKFNYFKKLIRNGECTFEFIKTTVLAKNGPYLQVKPNTDFTDTSFFSKKDDFNKMVEAEKNKISKPLDPVAKSLVEKLVHSLFPESHIDKIEPLDMPDVTKIELPKLENKEGKKKSSKKRKNQ